MERVRELPPSVDALGSFSDPPAMTARPLPDSRQAVLTCALAAVSGIACAGLLTAATLAPAPAAALPLLIVLCIGCPLLAAWELPIAVTVLRLRRKPPLGPDALSELRERLDSLPETEHPLGY